MAKLILLRHGESLYNKQHLFTGWSDVELSQKGEEEAKKAGQILRKHQLYPDICFTSWLKRAIHTAQLTLKELEWEHINCLKSWKLNERHYGAWQQCNKSAIEQAVGDTMFVAVRRGFTAAPPHLEPDDPRAAQREAKYHAVDPSKLPLGESLKQTQARVLAYYDKMIVPLLKEGQTVLICAHGNSLRGLVKMLENIDDKSIENVEVATGVPIIYTLDDALQVHSKEILGLS